MTDDKWTELEKLTRTSWETHIELWVLGTEGGTVEEERVFFSRDSCLRYKEDNAYGEDWKPRLVAKRGYSMANFIALAWKAFK